MRQSGGKASWGNDTIRVCSSGGRHSDAEYITQQQRITFLIASVWHKDLIYNMLTFDLLKDTAVYENDISLWAKTWKWYNGLFEWIFAYFPEIKAVGSHNESRKRCSKSWSMSLVHLSRSKYTVLLDYAYSDMRFWSYQHPPNKREYIYIQ